MRKVLCWPSPCAHRLPRLGRKQAEDAGVLLRGIAFAKLPVHLGHLNFAAQFTGPGLPYAHHAHVGSDVALMAHGLQGQQVVLAEDSRNAL